MSGQVTGLALRPERRAPMVLVEHMEITAEGGPIGDHAGRFVTRLVSMLSEEDWRAARDALDSPVDLPWTTRRANILSRDIVLPRVSGAVLRLGRVVLEITKETVPCARMDEAHIGLRRALAGEWRGGRLCKVVEPGVIALGDTIEILHAPEPVIRRLPG